MRKTGVVGLWVAAGCNVIALLKAVMAVLFIIRGHRPNYIYDPEAESSFLQSALLACSIWIAIALAVLIASIIALRRSHLTTTGT